MRLLRVLDLQDCDTLGDHKMIYKFLHLKYLSLSGYGLTDLPKSIGNLQNLETLDIRRNKYYWIRIPTTVIKLQQLRHLMISNIDKFHIIKSWQGYSFNLEGGMSLPGGVGNLKALQTLYYVDAKTSSKGTMRELAELTQLRKLGVTRLTEETGMEFCTALEKLSRCLRSLLVTTAVEFQGYEFLDYLISPPLHLQSLALGGNLWALPRWVASLRDVAMITLSGYEIKKKLLLPLQTLPSLINLYLVEWDGKGMQLCFHRDGFRSLKAMSLETAGIGTISLVFEEGAMPNLEKLRITKGYLQVLGMEYLASLREIEFYGNTTPALVIELEDIVRVHPNNPRLVFMSITEV